MLPPLGPESPLHAPRRRSTSPPPHGQHADRQGGRAFELRSAALTACDFYARYVPARAARSHWGRTLAMCGAYLEGGVGMLCLLSKTLPSSGTTDHHLTRTGSSRPSSVH